MNAVNVGTAGLDTYAANGCDCTTAYACPRHPWPFSPQPGGPVIGAPLVVAPPRRAVCPACGDHRGVSADNGKSKVRAACVCVGSEVEALRAEVASLSATVRELVREVQELRLAAGRDSRVDLRCPDCRELTPCDWHARHTGLRPLNEPALGGSPANQGETP